MSKINKLKIILRECIDEVLHKNPTFISLDEVTHSELADTRMDFKQGKIARELIDPPERKKVKKPIKYKIGNRNIVVPAGFDILLFKSKNPNSSDYIFAHEKIWCPLPKNSQSEYLS